MTEQPKPSQGIPVAIDDRPHPEPPAPREPGVRLRRLGLVRAGLALGVAGGELSIQLRLEKDGARSAVMSGADEFEEIVKHFGRQFQSIRGSWHYGTNLAKFNELTAAGKSAEEAALATWNDEQAAKAGFGKVTIRTLSGKPGAYNKVYVLFKK